MRTIPQTKQEVLPVSKEKTVEILATINAHWEDFYTAEELGSFIENGYVFGPFGTSDHYSIDFIMGLIKEVDLEKNPLPVIEG